MIVIETAKVFESGLDQYVCLPKKYWFDSDEVYVQQLGDSILLVPKDKLRQSFLDGLNSFTDDVFEDGRQQGH